MPRSNASGAGPGGSGKDEVFRGGSDHAPQGSPPGGSSRWSTLVISPSSSSARERPEGPSLAFRGDERHGSWAEDRAGLEPRSDGEEEPAWSSSATPAPASS